MILPREIQSELHITRPTLLLDPGKVERNIQRMVEKARRSRVAFRPHFKTHQSATIAEWFKNHGVDRCTVSSVDMAVYFANAGWKDLTVAFPFNLHEINKAVALAERVRLNLVVDDIGPLQALSTSLTSDIALWIKIETGGRRAGIPWHDRQHIRSVAMKIHELPRLNFAGLLAHSGNSYDCSNVQEIRDVYDDALMKLTPTREMLESSGLRPCALSVGDTPTASVLESFHGVDEVRPGNFIFYDLMQYELGVCNVADIALALACPVVSLQPERNEAILYGGAVHLSKDRLEDGSFGAVAAFEGETWQRLESVGRLTRISQEHGVLTFRESTRQVLELGDIVLILPVHSCLTADLHGAYRTLNGTHLERRRSNDEHVLDG